MTSLPVLGNSGWVLFRALLVMLTAGHKVWRWSMALVVLKGTRRTHGGGRTVLAVLVKVAAWSLRAQEPFALEDESVPLPSTSWQWKSGC